MRDKPIDLKQTSDSFFDQPTDFNSVVSAMDCTNLIPTLALSDDEVESYAEIHSIPKPSDSGEESKIDYNKEFFSSF